MRTRCGRTTVLPSFLILLSCFAATASAGDAPRDHGLVGLRILPSDAIQAKQSWLSGIGNYEDLCGQYPSVAMALDVIWGPRGCFNTDRTFFEWYVENDQYERATEVNPDPTTSNLVAYIRQAEQSGMVNALRVPPKGAPRTSPQEVAYILVCRETRLSGKGKPGPFKQDPRILYPEDVDALRKLFRDGHAAGLLKHDSYKLIQMVEHPRFFARNPQAQAIIQSMEGVAYEAHQFNRHWPLETGWSRPEPVVQGAKWTLRQGKEYIFYYGPFRYKQTEGYREFIERDWLYSYWKAGLPKRNPRMHYFLNAFPYGGCKRPVGPESDPHSNLGMAKWLIQQVRAESAAPEEPTKPSPATE
jgi:hypothetical protein